MRKRISPVRAPEKEVVHRVGEWASAVTVNWGNGTAALHSVRVHPAHRGEGLAHRLLEEVCTYADERHLTLLLIAESDEAIPTAALISLYTTADFVQQGKTSTMVRPPRITK